MKAQGGVGSAFWSGICEAMKRKADYVVNIDGDGQMDPRDMEKLLRPILDNEADMVTASRFKDPNLVPNMPKIKLWGNRRVADIVSKIVGRKYYDVACGYRAYNRETLLHLNLRGKFTYTQESFLNLASKSTIRIMEMPLAIQGERKFGKSRVASSICRYAFKSGSIILCAFKDYRPIQFYGSLSMVALLIGGILATIFFAHFIMTGRFSGFLWAGLSGAFMVMVSIILAVIMIVSDTLSRIIMNQEEILYYNKKREYYGEFGEYQQQKECEK